MNSLIKKIFLCAVLLSVGGLCFAGGPAHHNHRGNLLSALARAIEQQNLAARQAQESTALQVVTNWEKCDVIITRHRLRNLGRQMRIRKSWTCKQITTTCPAVNTENGIETVLACFYPKKDKNQDIKLIGSYLVQGKLLKQQLKYVSENAVHVLLGLI